MNHIIEFLRSDIASDLSIALLHTLWQALAIASILYITLKSLPSNLARWRYRFCIISLLAIMLCWLATFSVLQYDPPQKPENTLAASKPAAIQDKTQTSESTAPVTSAKSTPSAESPADNLTLGFGWIIIAWSAGVIVMLIRMFKALCGTARLRRDAVDIDDPVLIKLFDNLCQQMNIKQKIRFAATSALKHPGVIGILKPVMLMPISMLTEMPADHIQAIIAHELAHIRRYDFLVNFCQLLIEAIFFFNPAVWWINRQARIEREVCCDLAGIQTTGKRLKYAKILFEQLTRTAQPPQPAMTAAITGFSDEPSSNSAERVKRIIHPTRKPQMRIGWTKLAMLIAIASLTILALWKATDTTVTLTAKILTPKQQVEKMQQIAKTHNGTFTPYNESDMFTISGTVKTHDGKLLDNSDRSLVIHSFGPKYSGGIHIDHKDDGTYKHKVHCRGNAFVFASATGYALAISKTYSPEPNDIIENVDLVLEEGFNGKVKVIDQKGNPIEGATLEKTYFRRTQGGWSSFGSADIKTNSDKNGIATFKHCISRPTMINVRADGFQKIDSAEYTLKEGETIVITMQKGLSAGGVVVAKETGKPIEGAEFRLVHKERPNHSWSFGFTGQGTETVTDKDGKFTLNTLAEGTKYTYIVDAPGYNFRILPLIEHGDENIKIEMIPELYIKGTVTGDLSKLSRNYCDEHRKSMPSLWFSSYGTDDLGCPQQYGHIPVEIKDGIGHFTLKNILGNKVVIRGNKPQNSITFYINDKSIEDVVYDLDAKKTKRTIPTRQMKLTFKSPEGYPAPEGKARLLYITKKVYQSKERVWSGMDIIVENGIANVDFPANAYMCLTETKEINGFWIEPDDWEATKFVPASDQPYERTINAEPAGNIYGTITDENGKPIRFADMKLIIVKCPEKYIDHKNFLNIKSSLTEMPRDSVETGKYCTQALPLGGTYAIIAKNKHTWLFSKPIELTPDNPIREVNLRLEKPEQITGRILLPDNTPAKNIEFEMSINLRFSDEDSHGVIGHRVKTDNDGRFVYDRINPLKPLKYALRIKIPGYKPTEIQAKPGKDIKYKLEKGLTLTGKLIDAKTGWPVPDAWVSLSCVSCNDENHLEKYINADKSTDNNGNFIFTTLDNKRYRFYVQGADIVNENNSARYNTTEITAGKDKSINLRVNLKSYSKLKPRKPDEKN